jgi:putative DNA primase/helicase
MAAPQAGGASATVEAEMLTASEIAHALSGRRIGKNSFVARCPAHEDCTPSLSLRNGDDGRVLWKCFAGCSQDAVHAALIERGLLVRNGDRPQQRPAAPKPMPTPTDDGDAKRRAFAQAIWREAVDPRGTLAEKYLNGRGLELHDDLCGRTLRFYPRCPFGKDGAGNRIFVPALVVAFRPIRNDDESNPPQAIHRIGLKPDGSKIGKLMLGPVGGCAVKLDVDFSAEHLGIAEGVETAVAIRAIGWSPVWSLGSAGAIRTFAPIPSVTTLTIFADHDDTGLAAARECAQRWADAGCEAFIHVRAADGKDFADA